MPESDPENGVESIAPVISGAGGDRTPKPLKRVIYARKNNTNLKEGEDINPDDGEAITEELATTLKLACWGGADKPIKSVWMKQGINLHKPEKLFAYGLKMPKNDTKNFLTCLNAYFIKHLLFPEDDKNAKKSSSSTRKYNRKQKEEKLTDEIIMKKLMPKAKLQQEMIVEGLTEILFKAGKDEAIICIPGQKACFEPSQKYLNDTVTEKLRMFTCQHKNDLKTVLQSFLDIFVKDQGQGCMLVLYSLILSKGIDNIKADLQDHDGVPLVDQGLGECSQALLNLVICGNATPYVHNSTASVDDEGTERVGIQGRNDIGLLISNESALSAQVGVYLKTPILPMWLTKCEGQMGILFNPNKDLLRSKGAENKFNLYYYANYEFDKTETPKQTILTVDSRAGKKEEVADFDNEQCKVPHLETAISLKWEGAGINWNDAEPYIW